MTYPAVSDADTQSGSVGVSSSSWTITYPTNLVAGDLIALFVGAGVHSSSAPGFTLHDDVIMTGVGGTGVFGLLLKISDGTETGTFTLTMGASGVGGWRVNRITGWYGTIATGVSTLTAKSRSTTPDPPSLTPAWGSDTTLWFASTVLALGTISAYPSGFGTTSYDAPNAINPGIGVSRLAATTATEDPGTFTASGNNSWVAATIAIRPAGVLTTVNAGVATIAAAVNASSDTAAANASATALTLAAQTPTGTVLPNAGSSAMTLAASAPTSQAQPSAAPSAATFAAQSATPTAKPNAGSATGVVSALDGRALVIVPASVVAATVAALDASVTTQTGESEDGLATVSAAAPGAILSAAAAPSSATHRSSAGSMASRSAQASLSAAAPHAELEETLLP